MSVVLEPIQVSELVRDVRTAIEPLAAKNGNTLEVQVKGVSVVRGDGMQLRQALINLLGNACKFTENGTITLEVAGDPASDFYVAFNVRDTGIGMSEDQLSRLFQEYVQADHSIRTKYGGTGLGLSISKRFVEMMGGEISATSTLGQGSVFTLRIPSGYHSTSNVPDFTMPTSMGLTIVPTTSPDGMVHSVLLIDRDADALRQLVVRRLENDGFVVEACDDGDTGFEVATTTRYRAVLLDVAIPNGWEVLARLTGDERLLGVPVIVVSAEDDPERAHRLGAAACLTKPVDHDQLMDALRRTSKSAEVVVFEPDERLGKRISESMQTLGWRVSSCSDVPQTLKILGAVRRAVIAIHASDAIDDALLILKGIQGNPALRATPVVWIGPDNDELSEHMHCLVDGADIKQLPASVANAATRAFAQLAEESAEF